MTQVRVFYEDQAGRKVNNFGPHMLLCACVGDRTNVDLWTLKNLIDGQPKKSDSKLLEACRRQATLALDVMVFAVFDSDRIHRLPGMTHGTIEQMQAQLDTLIGSPKVRPFLLERNVESVVKATAGCLEPPVVGDIPKRHIERDRILNRAASDPSRSVRDCITEQLPSFAAIVDAVCKAMKD